MNILVALIYGFIWGVETPIHAYYRGQKHNWIVGVCYGFAVLSVYPVSILFGTMIATVKYWRSGPSTDDESASDESEEDGQAT